MSDFGDYLKKKYGPIVNHTMQSPSLSDYKSISEWLMAVEEWKSKLDKLQSMKALQALGEMETKISVDRSPEKK